MHVPQAHIQRATKLYNQTCLDIQTLHPRDHTVRYDQFYSNMYQFVSLDDIRQAFEKIRQHLLSSSTRIFEGTMFKVHNRIDAHFQFKEGLIVKHTDSFLVLIYLNKNRHTSTRSCSTSHINCLRDAYSRFRNLPNTHPARFLYLGNSPCLFHFSLFAFFCDCNMSLHRPLR